VTPAERAELRRIIEDVVEAKLRRSVSEVDADARRTVSDLRREREGVDAGISLTYERLVRDVVRRIDEQNDEIRDLRTEIRTSVAPRATGAEAAAVAGAQAALRVEKDTPAIVAGAKAALRTEETTKALAESASAMSGDAQEITKEAKRQRRATVLAVLSMIVNAAAWVVLHFLKG